MPKSIRQRRSLIPSPLAWQMDADPVAPPIIPVPARDKSPMHLLNRIATLKSACGTRILEIDPA
jgi:hypothetical protein